MRIPWPSGFQGRLLAAFASLLILAVVTTGVALSITSAREVDAQMQERLELGSRVLSSHLDARAEQLAAAVTVLTQDFGFKAAVASGDVATLQSTLANHGDRIGADLMVLVDREGRTFSPNLSAEDLDGVQRLVGELGEGADQVYTLGVQGKIIYQFFVMPVLAPDPVGWVVVAFSLDDAVVEEIATLTDLRVAFLATHRSGEIRTATPVSAGPLLRALDRSLLNPNEVDQVQMGSTQDGDYLTAVDALAAQGEARVYAVLGLPNSHVVATMRFQLLQVVGILLVALILVGAGGLTMARRMAAPVDRLIRTARVIEQGDYEAAVATDIDGELKTLGSALTTMRDAIRERERHIVYQANHDPLTGLPNRRQLDEHLANVESTYGICLLAITDLADITYGLGHDARDAYLRGFADRLVQISDGAMVARFSRDEFAVVLLADSQEEALRQTRVLHLRASEPVQHETSTVAGQIASASIHFPNDADRSDLLLRRLDATLATARNHPERCLPFRLEDEVARARQLAILSGFNGAFDRNEFFLLFQPKVSLPALKVTSCEALIRWVHPEVGFINPDEFIQLAERSGQIRELTNWVLDTAISQARRFRDEGLHLLVAINLSVHDVADPVLPDVVQRLLAKHGMNGSAILLEVTESAVMEDGARALQTLLALKQLGIRLSIDDFGTGHSSLGRLKELPVDELKIDKSFVLTLDQSAQDVLIVNSTIRLGHDLGLKVVAEGVESRASLDILIRSGCDTAQGYFFAKPLKPHDLITWAREFNSQHASDQEAVA